MIALHAPLPRRRVLPQARAELLRLWRFFRDNPLEGLGDTIA